MGMGPSIFYKTCEARLRRRSTPILGVGAVGGRVAPKAQPRRKL